MNPSKHRTAELLIAALGLTLFFNLITGFIQYWGVWYTLGSNLFHHQTDSFLRGKFALFDQPYFIFCDLAWSHGIQQVWGLGIPLLWLPFEFFSKIIFHSYFPDRLFFLLLFALTAFVVATVQFHNTTNGRTTLTRWMIVILMMCPAPLFYLIRDHYGIYEETVSYAYLWAILMFHILLSLVRTGRARTFLWLSAAAGFSVLIRPTLVFTALVSLGLGALSIRENKKLTRICGAMIFTGFVMILLATNLLRFGKMTEFGHALNLNSIELNTFALKFDYPFKHEPLLSAGKELLSILFGSPPLNSPNTYAQNFFFWQSPTVRYREFYSAFYGPEVAVLFFWGLASALLLMTQRKSTAEITVSARWATFSFLLLFLFYLKSPSITSRYLMDFLAPLNVGISLILLGLLRDGDKKWPVPKIGALLIVLVFVAASFAKNIHFSNMGDDRVLNRRAQLKQMMVTYAGEKNLVLDVRDTYRQGLEAFGSRLTYNGVGWDARSDGRIKAAVQLYFNDPDCVSVALAPRKNETATEADYDAIQVKVGLEPLTKFSQTENNGVRTLNFKLDPNSPNRKGFQVAFIGTVTPVDLGRKESPLALYSVSKFCENTP